MLLYEHKNRKIHTEKRNELSFPPHIHQSFEFVVCASGKAKIVCDGIAYILKKGDAILIMPHQIHSYENIGKCTIFMSIFSQISEKKSDYIPTYNMFHGGREIIALANSLLSEYNQDHTDTAIAYLNVMLCKAYDNLEFKKNVHNTDSSTFEKSLLYVSQNYTNNITLKSTAKNLGISPEYLSRLYVNKLSCNFTKYLCDLRIERAKKELADTNMKVSYIAFDCGFSTVRTFNRVFKSYTNSTPNEYRSSI